MVYIYRKPRETTASLLRRFSRATQQSGILARAKKKMYRFRPPSERVIKQRAIMRQHLRKLRARLTKLGITEEEVFHREKRKLKQKLGF